jgi:hypothetical protein
VAKTLQHMTVIRQGSGNCIAVCIDTLHFAASKRFAVLLLLHAVVPHRTSARSCWWPLRWLSRGRTWPALQVG